MPDTTPKFWIRHGERHELKLHQRPGYACGMTISLALARWIHTHDIVQIIALDESTRTKPEDVMRLVASDGTHRNLFCCWGIALTDEISASGTRVCARLSDAVIDHVDHIVAWEAAFPDEPKIGTRKAA